MGYRNAIGLLILLVSLSNCQGQKKSSKKTDQKVGGPCEGCEAIFEYGDKKLTAIDTLPDFEKTEPKLKLKGIVYKKDGLTPVEDVILYIYQTDRNGIYVKKETGKGWGKIHGYIRGWAKTDKKGNYTFYTFRPAAYPNRMAPEHIHITVKEPDKNEYYIDGLVFDDDPLLTQKERNKLENRGGSGIVKPVFKDGILTVNRNIILGANIPNYE